MSDSDDSQQLPSDTRIEQALRSVVVQSYKSGNLDDLTVKRVRRAAEEELGLEEDLLKTDARWKDRSKDVINAEVDSQEEKCTEPPPSSVEKSVTQKKAVPTKSSTDTKAAPAKERKAETAKKPTRRPPPASKVNPRKRQKVSVSESEAESSVLSSPEQTEPSPDGESDEESPPKKPRKSTKGPTKDESDNKAGGARVTTQTSDSGDDEAAGKPTASLKPQKPKANIADYVSESEMSVLIDEEPAPKKKRSKKPNSEKATKAAKANPSKGKGDESLDPQEAEIKRLQGWLVKCGIRKLWHRELAPYDTSKAKINHLKGMLKDAGMDGRYSAEKARQIKEQRELAADLEAVQEGAKRWGQGESEDDSGGKKPRRRLAKGLKDLAFLDDDDGEESG